MIDKDRTKVDMSDQFMFIVRVPAWMTTMLLYILGAVTGTVLAQEWTQFEMNRKDTQGRYLWSKSENWTNGLPGPELSVEIGDDHSGQALHCVIPKGCDAFCLSFELAEHARTQGTTLHLEEGASLTIRQSGILSKDRESVFYVNGTLRCTTENNTLRIGGPWGRPDINEPAACHLLIGTTGIVEAWFVGINTDHRAESGPSSPWGPRYWARSTYSEIVVTDGKLIARQGLRMSTCDVNLPGALKLRGSAAMANEHDSKYGIDLWCGIWEIDGGRVAINVGDIEFWGNKFEGAVDTKTNNKLGAGVAVLKLSGEGVSIIHARDVDFVDAAVLDVSGLKVPAGTYPVIDGRSLRRTNLRFAAGTDRTKWSLRFDKPRGDLLLTFKP